MNEIANLSIQQDKADEGLTDLHWAVITNDFGKVKLLLHRGANANEKTRVIVKSEDDLADGCDCTNGKFCYHVADEYGSEVKEAREVGQNALHLAARGSSLDIVRLALNCIDDVDAVADDGSTALHFSTQNPDVKVAEFLLDSGAKIDAVDAEGKTPFYLAVKFERLDLANLFLSRGANVNASTKSRSTPLYSALINTNVKLVKLLLNNGASIDVTNKQDENPLFYVLRVVEKGDTRLKLIQLLLDKGVSVNSRNGYGSTALHLAVEHRDADLVKLLVERGCSIDAKDCFDASPLSKAVCMNLQGMVKLLLELGAKVNDFVNQSSILEHAVIRRNENMVMLLLDHNADVNIGSERNTPMAAALQHKNIRIMQMLVEKGADINYRDRNGRTPLMHAIKELNYEMIRYLLQHGADINQRDNRGNTAFHVLFENYSNSEYSIEYFLDNGADINAENDDGLTPFTFMMKHSFTKNEVLLFVKRLSLMEAQNGYVNPKIVAYLMKSRLWWQYWTSCHSELDRMKEIKIFYEFSYFDILCKKYKDLISFLQNEKAVEAFETDVYLYNFCYYESMLVRNFSRKRERLRLLINCSNALIGLFEGVLPPEIVEKICEYMANEHLKKLLELFNAESKLREEASKNTGK